MVSSAHCGEILDDLGSSASDEDKLGPTALRISSRIMCHITMSNLYQRMHDWLDPGQGLAVASENATMGTREWARFRNSVNPLLCHRLWRSAL